MKTKLSFLFVAALFSAAALSAQAFTLTNIFGGDADDIADDDFITFGRKNGGGYETEGAALSDRLQLDFSSEKLDGRLRLQYQSGQPNGRLGDGDVRFRGYVRFRPVEWIGFAAGNEFFAKYAVAGSYLAAAGDNAKDARMAENGFAIIGEVAGLRLVANFGGSAFTEGGDAALNFGFDYNILDVATIGAAFKSVINDDFSASAYAGLTAIDGLILNVGFLYNATDDDFLASPSKMALSLSAGYEFASLGLGLFVDFASGLNSEYIEDGETRSYNDGAVPMLARGRVAYNVTNAFSLNLDSAFRMMIGSGESPEMVFYPYAAYKLADFGTLKAGARFNIEDGVLASFSIPLAWEYSIASR